MKAGRILAMQERKRAPEIIIFVRNGAVDEVYSNVPDVCVELADFDSNYDDPERDSVLCELEERTHRPDMHLIYN